MVKDLIKKMYYASLFSTHGDDGLFVILADSPSSALELIAQSEGEECVDALKNNPNSYFRMDVMCELKPKPNLIKELGKAVDMTNDGVYHLYYDIADATNVDDDYHDRILKLIDDALDGKEIIDVSKL